MDSVKKNTDLGACSHTEHNCSTFFSAGIPQAKNGKLLIVVYFTLEKYLYSLSFHMTTFVLFLLYENQTTCCLYRILITELHHFE